MDASKKHSKAHPKRAANPISRLLFWWMHDLFLTRAPADLRVENLYDNLPEDNSETLANELESHWLEEVAKGKECDYRPSLLKALIKTFGKKYMGYGVVMLIHAVVFRVSQPILLGLFIGYFAPGSTTTKEEAYWYGAGVIGLSFVMMTTFHHTLLAEQAIGMRCRVASCSLVYRKILRLSRLSIGQTAAGQVVNLMSNDVSRFDFVLMWLHYVWILPLQTAVILYFIYQMVGLAAVVGVGSLFLQTVPVQSYMSRLSSRFRQQIAKRTDERVHLMSEIISGIKVIKMYAWEKPFEAMVAFARKREIDKITHAVYLQGIYVSFMVFSERTSLYFTLVSYVLLGNWVTPDKVFAMAQFYNVLQCTMAIFYPQAVQMAAETRVSIRRLENFLLQDEVKPSVVREKPRKPAAEPGAGDSPGGVVLDNVMASWTTNAITPTLGNINLDIRAGTLCAIIGPVGAGKSSLLQVLLKELPVTNGHFSSHGRISYASQEPWLFAGTVRNNVLFGLPYDAKRYRDVVRACALKTDFEQLQFGDKTIVGERGVSLSGGQRARINLARAVYREADVYLLDDPLSAVDTHVSKHLFNDCIKGFLGSKTRILVTHQLQHLRTADLIAILDNGRIENQGTYSELLEGKTQFSQMLSSEKEVPATPESVEKKNPLLRRLSENSDPDQSQDEDDSKSPEAEENVELMAKGRLKSSIYWQYLLAGGSIPMLIALVCVLIIGQIASSGADFWVTYWTTQEEVRKFYTTEEQIISALDSNETFTLSPSTLSDLANESLSTLSDVVTTMLTSLGEDENTTLPTLTDEDVPTVNDTVFVSDSDQKEVALQELLSTETCIYIYSVFIVGSVVITTLRSLWFMKVCMNASRRLHNTMFNSIIRGTMRFFDTNPSGRILNRFSKDMGAIDEILPKVMIEAVQIGLVMTGILVLVAIVKYWFLVPMFFVGLLFIKIRSVYLRTAQDLKRLEGSTRSPVFSHLSATLHGLVTIRASDAQEMVRKEFDVHQDQHTTAWNLTITGATAFGFWLDFVSTLFVSCVTLYFLVFDDGSYGASVGLAISQSLILTGMLQYGIRQTAEVANQMTAVERVMEYQNIDKEDLDAGKKPPYGWPSDGRLKFEHLYLKYSQMEPPILKDLTFHIHPGHKVGIVGRTGAGKSSLITALFRLAPVDGSMLLDEEETTRLSLHDLRSRISIIPQEPLLFSATLRHNLDPFLKYPDHALWEALEEVELKGVVDSLEMVVSEGGGNLSSGQRQLVCLARAIVRNNKVLVLDEATANVDPQTDALIQATIRKKFADCTVLTIAHRLNTIMDSDRVLVMDAGLMVEFGHPHELLQDMDGHFYKMVKETGRGMSEQLHRIAREAFENRKNSEQDNKEDAADT